MLTGESRGTYLCYFALKNGDQLTIATTLQAVIQFAEGDEELLAEVTDSYELLEGGAVLGQLGSYCSINGPLVGFSSIEGCEDARELYGFLTSN